MNRKAQTAWQNYQLEDVASFQNGGCWNADEYAESGITVENEILKNLCNCVKYHNRGVKRKDFRVISKIKSQGVCSALLEVCFIDNSNDIEIYQKKL